MIIQDYPIINKVAGSQDATMLPLTEQELFAVTCILCKAREASTSAQDKKIIQGLINQCCESLEATNPGFIESLNSMQRTIKQRFQQMGRKIKNTPPRDRRRRRR